MNGATEATPSTSAAAAATSCQPSSGVMITAGLARAGVEVALQRLLPGGRLGAAAHRLAQRDAVGGERGGERRGDEQRHEAPDQHPPRPAADDLRDPLPAAAVPVLGAVLRAERPERGAAQQHQDGGQEGERGEHGQRHAHRGDRAEAAVGAEVGEEQAEDAEDDRGAARDDRRPRLPQRDPHGGVLRPLLAQFLAVPGDEQQAVVGGGAHDQDRGDPLALAVDGDPARLRQQVGDGHRRR